MSSMIQRVASIVICAATAACSSQPARTWAPSPVLDGANSTCIKLPSQRTTVGTPCRQMGVTDFGIDAVTGEADTTTSFGQGALVRVVVRDVNPFAFRYSIQTKSATLPEPSPSQFFSALPMGLTIPTLGAGSAPTAPGNVTGAAASSGPNIPMKSFLPRKPAGRQTGCPAVDDARKSVEQDTRRLERDDRTIGRDYSVIVDTVNAAQREWITEEHLLVNPSMRADGLIKAAKEEVIALSGSAGSLEGSAATVHTDFDGVASHTGTLKADLAAYAAAFKTCPATKNDSAKYNAYVASANTYADQVAADTVRYAQALKGAANVSSGMRQASLVLESTANDRQQFYKVRLLDRYTSPSDVTIAVVRTRAPLLTLDFSTPADAGTNPGTTKTADSPPATGVTIATTTVVTPPPAASKDAAPKTAKDAGKDASPPQQVALTSMSVAPVSDTTIQTRLNFGGRGRFVLAAGFAAAYLPERQYAPLTRLGTPTPARPADTVITVVGDPTTSVGRVTPMLTLNTLISAHPRSVHTYATVGAGLHSDDTKQLDYLAALGFGFWADRVIVSLGGYAGQRSVLAGGLRVGDRLSAGTTSVPTQNLFVFAPALGITFRLLPWGGSGSQ